jgi:threonine/homoserine/homoserine lactone efflux protein
VDALALGLALGLGAGLAPGPLLALIVAATLERGFSAGARVAVAPLITDAPIVVLCIAVLSGLPEAALAGLSFAGAAFVAYLALEAVRRPLPEAPEPGGARELRRAATVNALSPHPWIFWISVGGPLLVEAADRSPLLAAGFLVAFYATLVGTKLVLCGLVDAGRNRGWRRAVPGTLTTKVGAPGAIERIGRLRVVSAALLGAAAVALAADGLARL